MKIGSALLLSLQLHGKVAPQVSSFEDSTVVNYSADKHEKTRKEKKLEYILFGE